MSFLWMWTQGSDRLACPKSPASEVGTGLKVKLQDQKLVSDIINS